MPAALLLLTAALAPAGDDAGPLARALWLVHRHGTAEAAAPGNDASTKGRLSRALGVDGTLTAGGVRRLIDRSTFDRLAGADGTLDALDVEAIVIADVPESRNRLIPEVRAHADLLATSFDRIDEAHLRAGGWLADWIAANYTPGEPLHVIVICTGNSRRSMMGATMGNIAAAYSGMPEVRFHSGGTEPSAFNRRTIAALREVGVVVEPTGDEAPRGEPGTPNPVFAVRWGVDGAPAMEAREFSKAYGDPSNPREGFAAVLVCGEADAACPLVEGAALRIPMPYLDPKIFDDSRFEAATYAERRDDIGRVMLGVMMQARRRVAPAGDTPRTPLHWRMIMSQDITRAVRSKYGSVAGSGLSGDLEGVRAVAEAFGYAPEELASIPAAANLGLSCGNPTATANLREGEVVVDLGSGGGIDVLLAARKVGPTGRAVGIDMTPEMIDLARRNAEHSGVANAEFHLAEIHALPLPDASADCVISNCVINLAPDKPAVLREVARVLKPGGRLAVSDIALKKDLPGELAGDLMAYVGCIAGAVSIDDYRRMLRDAGFELVEVVDTGADLNAYAKVENQAACCSPPAPATTGLPAAEAGCCSPTPAAATAGLSVVESVCCTPAPAVAPDDAALHARLADLLRRYDVNDYAASVRVFALKPR